MTKSLYLVMGYQVEALFGWLEMPPLLLFILITFTEISTIVKANSSSL